MMSRIDSDKKIFASSKLILYELFENFHRSRGVESRDDGFYIYFSYALYNRNTRCFAKFLCLFYTVRE